MGTFHCGHGKGGNGCGKGGDAISYLQEFRGLSFQDACGVLGLEAGKPSASRSVRSPREPKPKKMAYHEFDPRHVSWPDIITDSDVWQQHAEKFVQHCHEALLQRQKTLDYLSGRGIDLVQVRSFRLGINLGETRKGIDWEPTFRPRKSWGMSEDRPGSRPQMFVLPAGIVIPWYNQHGLRRIRIRLAKKDPLNPKKKYHVVLGSAMDLWLTGEDREAFIVIETELDAVMIDRFCDQVGVLALGAVAFKPDKPAAFVLGKAHTILNGLDYDSAAVKPSIWWEQQYPQCKRWPVPDGKDPGEAYEAGVDIKEWIMAGLPAAMQIRDTGKATGREQVAPEKKADPVKADELSDLFSLVEESGGLVRIYDNGGSVGFSCNNDWAATNQAKRTQISGLINSLGPAGNFIASLPDGNYPASGLRRILNN